MSDEINTVVIRILALITVLYPLAVLGFMLASNIFKLIRLLSFKEQESDVDDDFEIHVNSSLSKKGPESGKKIEVYAPKRKLKIGKAYPIVDGDGDVLAMAKCVADLGDEKKSWINVFKVNAPDNVETRNLGDGAYRFEILE